MVFRLLRAWWRRVQDEPQKRDTAKERGPRKAPICRARVVATSWRWSERPATRPRYAICRRPSGRIGSSPHDWSPSPRIRTTQTQSPFKPAKVRPLGISLVSRLRAISSSCCSSLSVDKSLCALRGWPAVVRSISAFGLMFMAQRSVASKLKLKYRRVRGTATEIDGASAHPDRGRFE